MDKLIFGSDPEGFYATLDADGHTKVVPPAKYRLDYGFPTDNTDPRHPVFATAEGQNGIIKLIEDGAAFELTVPPSENIEGLYKDIQTGYELAAGVAKQFGNFIEIVPTIPFDVNEFRDRESDFKRSLIFGCDPDRDVFESQGLVKRRPMQEEALDHPWRYGGGHLHLSGIENFQTKPLLAIKMLALFIGNLVTFRSPMLDLDHMRTYRYGMPGRFRIQDYGKRFNNLAWTDIGVEYRTPSNAWTTDMNLGLIMEEVIKLIAERVLPDDNLMQVMIEDSQDNTIKAVMEGDPVLAESNFNAVMSFVQ